MATSNGAVPKAVSGSWLTAAQQDQVTGYPDTPLYPGPITTDHADPGAPDPGRAGPLQGAAAPPVPQAGGEPQPDLSGGMVADTVAELGYSAPVAAFDSSAGEPFAPSGPIAPTHGYDTGGTGRKEHVPVPDSPGWWRRTLTGQTTDRTTVFDPTGKMINDPGGRTNLDQAQGQNANGYDPFVIPYSERPLRANFAAAAYPVEAGGGVYGVEGALPDMAAFGGQGNWTYTAPPDPAASTSPPPAAAAAPAGEGAALGMEYVSG